MEVVTGRLADPTFTDSERHFFACKIHPREGVGKVRTGRTELGDNDDRRCDREENPRTTNQW